MNEVYCVVIAEITETESEMIDRAIEIAQHKTVS